jgi:ankyrin repeat protein
MILAVNKGYNSAGVLILADPCVEIDVNELTGMICGLTVFELAVVQNRLEIVSHMLKHRKPDLMRKIPAYSEGGNILFLVRSTEMMKLLLESIENKSEMINSFVENPSTVEYKRTILHEFAEWDDFEKCKMLVDAGADEKIKNGKGKNAIELATNVALKCYLKNVDPKRKNQEMDEKEDMQKAILSSFGSLCMKQY